MRFAVRSMGFVVLSVATLLVPALLGCESESPSEIRSFTDSSGRSCTVDYADISHTATCDADPALLVSCSAGTVAVFHIDGDFEPRILANCGACKNDTTRETIIDGTACANVTCDADIDCVYDNYSCQSGTCIRN